MTKTKTKTKRPPSEPGRLDHPVGIKATPEQVAAWEAAAAREQRTLSNWIRMRLDAAAEIA